MNVHLGKRKIRLDRGAIVGQGGEAEVYGVGPSEVIKLFKQPSHPDFAADASLRAAAAARIDEHQKKLADFPRRLPHSVIGPDEVATDRAGRIVGYSMRRIENAEPLYALAQARTRRSRGLTAQTNVLVALHRAVVELHKRSIIIGDFNDLNVLVRGDDPFLIDCDSFQFGAYRCPVYSERFLDPRLFSSASGTIDYSTDSDWFAFAALAVQTLLSVGPYGGVHQPSASKPRIPSARRSEQRASIFNAQVKLPRPALSPAALPTALRSYFEGVFARDEREPMPLALLTSLSWRTCPSCSTEFATRACPSCSPQLAHAVVHSSANATEITNQTRARAIRELADDNPRNVWLDGRRLVRKGLLGPEHIGNVLAGSTRFWVGDTFGFGVYAASRFRVGFVFDNHRVGLNDSVEVPVVTGSLAELSCTLSSSRAWLTTVSSDNGVLNTRVTAFDRRGAQLASTDVSDVPWRAGLSGACAIGDVLLVPTDEGIVRVETSGGAVGAVKTFSESRSVLDSASQLVSDGRALFAISGERIFELSV